MAFAAFPAPPSDDVQLDTQLYTMIELEGNRYRAFYAKLSGGAGGLISRNAAVEFFRKSSLSEEQVQELYTRLKGQQLLRDYDHMNETEFVMGMHLIVCITKRNLAKIPPTFPRYLFPMLDLTPEKPSSFAFPSALDNCKTSSGTPLVPLLGADNQSASLMAVSSQSMEASVVDAKSLSQLVNTVIHSKQREAEILSKVDQSESRALQSLQVCMERIADQVDGLGFPVPSSARSLDSMDDLKSLLQKHVQSAKQEIQTMQIDAQMRSVASEVAQNGSSDDALNVVSHLTQELMVLQQQTAQLMAKNADIVRRLVAVTSGGSLAGSVQQSRGSKNPAFANSKGALTVGELGTAAAATLSPKNVEPSLIQTHNSASSGGGWGTFDAAPSFDPRRSACDDPFAFGSADPVAVIKGSKQAEETQPCSNDSAWSAF